MEVILRDEVYNLGKPGEIVKVRDGYARNYLLPRKLAVLADTKNMRMLEHERRQISTKQSQLKQAAEAVAKQLLSLSLAFSREVGEEGKLFGSVTAHDIGELIAKLGVTIDRRKIRLQEPIKTVGEYSFEVRLHAEVHVPLTVRVEAAA
ncbi:MAG: 50S ribosomal protein L9 [Deltaproteobacteria bacterium]|nr:50S ribosomal protein L9 [Deltaproteobacteria bacterium]